MDALIAQGEETKDEEVPPELIARGRPALEAYNKALTEGKIFDKRVPVMLIGQERSGKTSLKKSLKGEPFKPDEKSTVGIDVDPSHFKVTTEVWKVGEEGQQTNSETPILFEHHAARATVKILKEQEEKDKKERAPDPEERISEAMQSGNIPMEDKVSESASCDATSVLSAVEFVVPSASSHTSDNKSISLLSTSSQDDNFKENPDDSESVQTSRHPEQEDSMPKNVETEVSKILGNGNQEDEDVYFVLWDFAGQSVYYTIHPLFLTSRAIYLLIDDLSQDPEEAPIPILKQELFGESEDSCHLKTNLDCLYFWMSSVASLASQQESGQVSSGSEVLPEKLPAVFLVFTHADTPYGQCDPNKLALNKYGALRTKPYKTHLYHRFFVVDNTKSGSGSECPEVVCLRKEVLAVSKELPQMKEAIPIKWLQFEKELQDTSESGENWITLETAKTVASEKCNIVDDTEFRTLLNFLHDKRILIHFDDTLELDKLVILNPQWLIDVFKKVITVKHYDHEEKKFYELWQKLQDDGILEETLLEHAWSPLFDSKETPESLIALMEKFSLLCTIPSSDASSGKQYLVPSMLMSHPPEGIIELVKSAQIPPLFLKFQSGHVPPGLFPRLVLQFFQWVKDECMSQDVSLEVPELYHNFARFDIPKEENCFVILLCHLFSIEVVVHTGNTSPDLADSLQSKLTLSADTSQDTSDVTCARAVRRQLGLMLESMRNEFFWLKNMRYEVSYICPVCCEGGSVTNCRTHRKQGCKEKECLHLLSETQLCSDKSITCKRSAVAKNSRVQIEKFAPWLLPPGNQLAVDVHDRGNLASATACREVALPGKVQESLLSESCDAKEVVRQLGKTVPLDLASLRELEPETKTLVRCLATKAKDSNRIDVFEHLREIAPAGTTGPLLSENLNVLSIPVAKSRELTIDLSGRDEWKDVAEALGLTQSEIRFLDKRTLNPLDAALAFIAQQRHITVGELYDLLNKLGLPVIADLL